MTRRAGIDGLDVDLTAHRAFLAAKGGDSAALHDRLLVLLATALPMDRLAALWADREVGSFYERPLMLLAALRFDALGAGGDHPLHAALVDGSDELDAVTADAVARAIAPDRADFWAALGERYVQTNDTTRAVTWLYPVGLAPAGVPIALLDVGASAGLNLLADRLPAPWTTPDGARLPVAGHVNAVARVGLDLRPADVTDPDTARWLRACVWPNDRARLARLEASIAAAQQAGGVPVTQAGVADAPAHARALTERHPGAIVVAYQSIVRDYLSTAERAAYEAGMRAWLGDAAPGRALWLVFETGAGGPAAPLPVDLTAEPSGGEPAVLARCAYHPTVVEPVAEAADRLRALLAANRSR